MESVKAKKKSILLHAVSLHYSTAKESVARLQSRPFGIILSSEIASCSAFMRLIPMMYVPVLRLKQQQLFVLIFIITLQIILSHHSYY